MTRQRDFPTWECAQRAEGDVEAWVEPEALAHYFGLVLESIAVSLGMPPQKDDEA